MPRREAPRLLFEPFPETALYLAMLDALSTIDFFGTAVDFVEQIDLILNVFEARLVW